MRVIPKLAGCVVVAAVVLHGPAHGFAASLQAGGAPPTEREQDKPHEQKLAAIPPSTRQGSASEPFDETVESAVSGEVSSKWRAVETAIAAEAVIVDLCLAQGDCPAAARAFLDIVAEGRARNGLARIGVINRAVNLAIVPTSDMDQWGEADHWSPPLETLTTRRGDCEDYAIAKYVALIDAGVAREDVKIVILRNRFPDEDHAVVAARVDATWLVLDNRSLALVPLADIRAAIPLFVLDETGARMFLPGTAGAGSRPSS